MIDSYKNAGFAGIASLLLGIIAAFIALPLEGIYNGNQYIIFTLIMSLSVLFHIIYYRGWIILGKRLNDSRFVKLTLSVFVLTLLSTIIHFVYSSVLYTETLRFSLYESLMHQDIVNGSLIFSMLTAVMGLLFGYALIKLNIQSRLVRSTGMLFIVSSVVILLISDLFGEFLYLIAGIMSIVILFRAEYIIKRQSHSNEVEEKKVVEHKSTIVNKHKAIKKTVKSPRKSKSK